MKKVLFTGDTISEKVRSNYKERGIEIIPAPYDLTEDAVAEMLKTCDGYILGGDEIASQSLIEKAGEKLKAISFFGAGYERYVDAQFAKTKDILVSNTPGANANSVAEFAVALLLSTVKRIIKYNQDTKNGNWDRPKTIDITGKTVGIIGMGNVGKRVAKILHYGFGCKILYASNNSKAEINQLLGAKKVNINELLSQSNFVLIHAALNDQTNGLLNESNLNLLKDNSIIINTARAEIIDENAMINLLRNSNKGIKLSTDVFYEEPITGSVIDKHDMLKLSNDVFVVTPHMAYYTVDAIANMEQMALENIYEMLMTGTCSHIVNK